MSANDIPADLRYSTDHEWVRAADGEATVGITAFAQDALGDVVFVSLPAQGDAVTAGQECGEIESTKSVSPIVAPVSGTVSAVNGELDTAPEAVNADPYGGGWMFRVAMDDAGQLDGLLDADGYATHIA